jgi:hypothetical protein
MPLACAVGRPSSRERSVRVDLSGQRFSVDPNIGDSEMRNVTKRWSIIGGVVGVLLALALLIGYQLHEVPNPSANERIVMTTYVVGLLLGFPSAFLITGALDIAESLVGASAPVDILHVIMVSIVVNWIAIG